MENLLDNHPDGLGKYIQVLDADQMDEATIRTVSEQRLITDGAVVVAVTTIDGRHLLMSFDTDLVHDAVERGNPGIDEWVSSKSGIHYRDLALKYLDVDVETAWYGILRFTEETN
jgi:hypothetical protein